MSQWLQVSLNQAIESLSNFATAHKQIHSFRYGTNKEQELSESTVYPEMAVYPTSVNVGEHTMEYTLRIELYDLERNDVANTQDVQSDLLQVCVDAVNFLRRNTGYYWNVKSSTTATPFTQRNTSVLAGWSFNVTLVAINNGNICDIPGVQPTEPIDLDLTDGASGCFTFPCLSATSISAGSFFSGSTPLSDIIINLTTGITSTLQSGFSGWTASTGVNSIIANNGSGNVASGNFAIAGGTGNTASGLTSFIGGGILNITNGARSFIGGGQSNVATANNSAVLTGLNNKASGLQSVVVGGSGSLASGNNSVIGGGFLNSATTTYSTVSGGRNNVASGTNSFIGGGNANSTTTTNATVVGGTLNRASGIASFIGGGNANSATTTYSTIGGGHLNKASGLRSFVGGGQNNTARTSYSIVVGGQNNIASGKTSFVGGGNYNTASGHYSSIVGGSYNVASGAYSFIGGGGGVSPYIRHYASGKYSTIGGGAAHTSSGYHSTIAGGTNNIASGNGSAILGGSSNEANNLYSSVLGGKDNHNSGDYSSILAGRGNIITGNRSAIGAGQNLVNSFDDTFLIQNLTANTISGTTFYSGNTELSSLFALQGTQPRISQGNNIQTGGTISNPIISTVDSPQFNNITSTGNSIFNTLSASTLSAKTIWTSTISGMSPINIEKVYIQNGSLSATGFNYQDGNQSLSKILTSDASGNATWQVSQGNGILTFMLYSGASDIATYNQMPSLSNYIAGTLTTSAYTVTPAPTVIGNFATNVGFPNRTIIPVGSFLGHYETQKGAGSNNYYTYFEVYKRNTLGSETLLVTSDNTSQTSVNTVVQNTTTAFISSAITISATDRIVMKIYAVMITSSANITLRFDNTTNARLELPSQSADATNFIPYTGATSDVNLGSHNLTNINSFSATSVFANSITGVTISGGTIYSGSTELGVVMQRFVPTSSSTNIANGTNTYTGGTSSVPSINVSGGTFNNINATGTSVFNTLNVATMSGTTGSFASFSATSLSGTTLTLGLSGVGGSQFINATLGAELAPALSGATTVNWTFGAPYTTPLAGTINKSTDGITTITPTAASTIVIGTTYKVVIVVSAITVATGFYYTLGNVLGTIITSAGTYTDYITATSTGNLIITPFQTGTRWIISSISIKAVTSGTGAETIEGKLTVGAGASLYGKIGIGMSNPLYPLQINVQGTTQGAGTGLVIGNPDILSNIKQTVKIGVDNTLNCGWLSVDAGNNGVQPFKFNVNSGVAIGKDNNTTVNILGTGMALTIQGINNGADVQSGLELQNSGVGTTSVVGRVSYYAGTNLVSSAAVTTDGATDAGYYVISTKHTGASNAERLRINSSGNVGVGTSASTSNFQVSQNTVGIGTITTDGVNTVSGITTQFTNTFKVGDTITASGVTRTISVITSDVLMTTQNPTWGVLNTGTSVYTLVGGDNFAIKGNGRVGVGTTTPKDLFHVFSTSSNSAGLAVGDGVVNRGLNIGYNSGNVYFNQMFNDTNGDFYFRTMVSAANPISALTIKGGGNVGFGTTTPRDGMEITGNTIVGGNFSAGTNNATNYYFGRRLRRVVNVASSAGPTINTDTTDVASITGLTVAITGITVSGTPNDGDLLEIRITDNGTARALTFGPSFSATTVSLPTTTVINNMLRTFYEWNVPNGKWDIIRSA